MVNLFANKPGVFISRETIEFNTLGFNASNIKIIYEVGNTFKTWEPDRDFNQITGFVKDEGYFIYPKVNMSLGQYLAPSIGVPTYIASDGLETGEGFTPETAISVARFAELEPAPRAIFLQAGSTFRGKFELYGNSSIKKYGTGSNPVISGTIPASALTWTQNGSIWSANYASRVGKVFRGGVQERTAQSVDYNVTSGGSTNTLVTTATGLGSWVADAELLGFEWEFRVSHYDIATYNTNGTIVIDRVSHIGNPAAGSTTNNFKLFNHPNLISVDGDWAWVNGVVYYRSPGNVNPGTLNVEISVFDEGVLLQRGGRNMAISNIEFFGQAIDGIYGYDVHNVSVSNCAFKYQLNAGIALMGDNDNPKVNNCSFYFPGAFAVVCHRQFNYEYGNLTIEGVGMGPDLPFCRGRGTRYDSPLWETAGHAFYVSSASQNGNVHDISANNLAYSGIRAHNFGDDTLLTISRCKVWDFGKKLGDGGGIYTGSFESVFGPLYGWKVDENIEIFDCVTWDGSGPNVAGIYIDAGAQKIKIFNNTCYRQVEGMRVNLYNRTMDVYGNTMYDNERAQIVIFNSEEQGAFITEDVLISNNILVAVENDQPPLYIASRDPEFFNPFVNGGGCSGNVFISPKNLDIVKTGEMDPGDYTLAEAQARYTQPMGVLDPATNPQDTILSVNVTGNPVAVTIPGGYRMPTGKTAPAQLLPFKSLVFVKT